MLLLTLIAVVKPLCIQQYGLTPMRFLRCIPWHHDGPAHTVSVSSRRSALNIYQLDNDHLISTSTNLNLRGKTSSVLISFVLFEISSPVKPGYYMLCLPQSFQDPSPNNI